MVRFQGPLSYQVSDWGVISWGLPYNVTRCAASTCRSTGQLGRLCAAHSWDAGVVAVCATISVGVGSGVGLTTFCASATGAASTHRTTRGTGNFTRLSLYDPVRVCTIAIFPAGALILPVPSDSTAYKTARYVLIGALLLLGGWMLQRFLPALSWAVVLAVATASLYDRWLKHFKGPRGNLWAAVTFTAIVGAIVVLPLIYFGFVAVRETASLVRAFAEASHDGPPPLPTWIRQLPTVGDWIQSQWVQLIGEAGHRVGGADVRAHPTVLQWTRTLGLQIMHRVVTLGFTLLTFFF